VSLLDLCVQVWRLDPEASSTDEGCCPEGAGLKDYAVVKEKVLLLCIYVGDGIQLFAHTPDSVEYPCSGILHGL
jgi:hypothetical protein